MTTRSHDRLVQVAEAEAVGDPFDSGLAENLRPAADDDRHVPGRHAEGVECRLHPRVRLRVEIFGGLVVPGQELPQRQRCGAPGRADEDDVLALPVDERGAAQQEDAQEDGAQLGVVLDERPQPGGRKLEESGGADGAPARHDGVAGQQIDVAGEGPFLRHRHSDLGAEQDLDRPLEDHEERTVAIPRFPQDGAVGEVARLRQRLDPIDLMPGQGREHLLFDGGQRFGHVFTWRG
jgi:hypothetical protein